MENITAVSNALTQHNIPFRIYHPLPWQAQAYRFRLPHGNWLTNTLSSMLRVNKRHHSKVIIIDRFYLACGSLNISDNHLSLARGGRGWHDFGAIVSGDSVADIATAFDDQWNHRKPRLGQGVFRYYWDNLTTKARVKKHKFLQQRLNSAQHIIWIVNPYFSPPRGILRALCAAATRGVDVRLIVPRKSDISFFPLLTSTYYKKLLANDVRIFEYLPSILHGKLLIADDFYLMGSTNLNHRSLLHDLEFDIVLDHNHSKAHLDSLFLNDQTVSAEIAAKDLTLFGKRRLLGWIPWLLRYWL
jgi:cardiolipin synthase